MAEPTREPRCSSLTSAGSPEFDAAYRVYAQSINPREQKSRADLARLVERADYRFLVLHERDRVVAVAILFVPDDRDFFLVEYMAVDPSARNRGLGARLFREVVKRLLVPPGKQWVLLEVDADRDPAGDRPLVRRRIEFYRRLGCLTVDDFNYVLPLPGVGNPPPMNLMVRPAAPRNEVSRSELEGWLKTLYVRVYSQRDDDARIARMLAPLPDRVPLHP